MKLGRISVDSPDGPVARLVAALPEEGRVVDLATAQRLRLERGSASPGAARRLAAALFPPSMAAALELGEVFTTACATAVAQAGDAASLAIDEVRWLPPVDAPLLRDFLAFEEHLHNSFRRLGNAVPAVYSQIPIYYKGNSSTLVGHDTEIAWPLGCDSLDYELELGFVIGRSCIDATLEQARRSLFGITILNDFSARDLQTREMAGLLGPAKGKDFATALGPWITTTDELDPAALTMCARVNGEEWSRGSSATITWAVEELIAYASRSELLAPGEVLGSGTVGRGCGLELDRELHTGDVVELEVEGIGVLRNRIGERRAGGWVPTPRAPAVAGAQQ
ncbi:MAG TPA: fumarylacetoacetate hydrolase family protein [Candidatus Dormibacteraeota bacterium]|jgi:2-keto-4-pentenoate hydratase/2-oxohepta-3-ene-1,7-dioic acid hydratase in catechol pathway|nr:fumarylacetoacetate hydrolase family protein [Candidatus Dormibacteraeota bacterium]